MAEISTLVEDIYRVLDPENDHEVNEDNLNAFGENLKDLLRTRLRKRDGNNKALRFSALGKPDRQQWYKAKGYAEEALPKKAALKFLYGDIIEQVLLLLAKEAGHSVEQEQAEVEVLGVKGHIDAIIDGVVVDAKSASPLGFKKLRDLTVLQDDDFGYVAQLGGYANVLTPGKAAAWLVADKVDGDLCLPMLSADIVAEHKPEPRIQHLQEVLANAEPPPRCFEPVKDGESGNMKLDKGCSYCSFKKECWPTARKFLYSNGPRYLTTVAREPAATVFEDKEWK